MTDAQQPVTTLPTMDEALAVIRRAADYSFLEGRYEQIEAALAPVFARAEMLEDYMNSKIDLATLIGRYRDALEEGDQDE